LTADGRGPETVTEGGGDVREDQHLQSKGLNTDLLLRVAAGRRVSIREKEESACVA
jgi:hypothetical protein